MKQILLKEPKKETIYLENMSNVGHQTNEIIVYVTKAETGMAILVRTSRNEYGFAYHKDLIRNSDNNVKYKGDTPKECITKAIEASRSVYKFYDFEEFLKFASDYTKL